MKNKPQNTPKKPSLFALIRPYRGLVATLVVFTIVANGFNLFIPKIIASAIDAFGKGTLNIRFVTLEFVAVSVLIVLATYAQSLVQVYASERVAKDLRAKVSARISKQDHSYVDAVTPSKLLTNLTSDADAVKSFVSQAIASIISSIFLIIGSAVLLISINWRLACVVLLVVPIIGITFAFVLGKVRKLFTRAQQAIDWLNKVINESILGAALIRLVNSQQSEYQKFIDANTEAKSISLSILRLFAALIPVITFASSLAVLAILLLGGHFVIGGTMTLGELTAFNSYLAILIFPILVIGFMSGVIAQAQASYGRIEEVLATPERLDTGTLENALTGDVVAQDVSLSFGDHDVLKRVSLHAKAGTRTAIIGPTAAGKTQLLYTLAGLMDPKQGTVTYDGHAISEYKKQRFHEQVGFVFQDSSMFNLSLRENIAFSPSASDESLQKAIDTAELADFIDALPDGLNTVVSERGTSLSGGQKQRVMLARALALNPKVLLLDDFTARVDARTEKKILENVRKNYPQLTLISVTQKIASVEAYDQIILLMEGEVLAVGTHAQLMETSPEYVQIYNSQKSTETYELHA